MRNYAQKAGKIDEKFFSRNSEDAAYVLGLLFSDGYLVSPKNKRKHIGLKLIDFQILKDIKSRMGMSNKIYEVGTTSAGNQLYRIEINNPVVVSDLEKFGMHERKTFSIVFPKDVPERYARDFIRGYFDGDGCINITKKKGRKNSFGKSFSILGTKCLLDEIAKRLPCNSFVKEFGKIYRLTVNREEDLRKVYQFLYSDWHGQLCLNRKRDHFQEVLSVLRDAKARQSEHVKVFSPRFSREEFEMKANEVHGDRYKYHMVSYLNNETPVTIVCDKHGAFEQLPNKHLIGHGCQKCNGDFMDKEYFAEKARQIHDKKYSYDMVVYENNRSPVSILCSKHGVFRQTPSNHLLGRGCRKCGIEHRKDLYEKRSAKRRKEKKLEREMEKKNEQKRS